VLQRLSTHCTTQEQLQLHILDFMLRQGHHETARLFCEQQPWLRPFSDALLYRQLSALEQQIKAQEYA
jgi:hypothetical protein